MKPPLQRTGFTLVELMVGMLAAAVLALTAGLMLFYGYKGWRQDRDGAAMQQDGCVAVEVLSRAVRSATNVVTAANVLTATVSNRTLRISAQGRNLVYDPSISVTGNEITVVSGRLERFSITNTSGTVRFVLEMTAGDGVHRERLEGSYTCRN